MTPDEYIALHQRGTRVRGTVLSCHQYGCWVELDDGVEALLEVIDFTPQSLGLEDGARIRVEDLPDPGDEIEAYLYLFSRKGNQIRLTMWERKLN